MPPASAAAPLAASQFTVVGVQNRGDANRQWATHRLVKMKSAINELVTSTKSLDVDASGPSVSSSTSSNDKFVNTGLNRWEDIRKQWVSSAATVEKSSKRHAKDIDIDEVIDLVVSNRWRQQVPKGFSSSSSSLDTAKSATKKRDDACFASPIALPQMVDLLVDLWEAEGLDI